jgi:hypothetical protein
MVRRVVPVNACDSSVDDAPLMRSVVCRSLLLTDCLTQRFESSAAQVSCTCTCHRDTVDSVIISSCVGSHSRDLFLSGGRDTSLVASHSHSVPMMTVEMQLRGRMEREFHRLAAT